MQLSRRSLIRALPLGLAAPAAAQTPAATTPEADLEAARALIRRNTQAMDSVRLPMSTEPAAQFKA
jgi:hypothetical protein